MKKIRIIVAHPGVQHSFRLAKAINQDKRFELIYITSVYDKEKSLLMNLIKHLLNRNNVTRANNRKCKYLSDNQVVQFCELMGLIRIALAHYDKSQKLFHWLTCKMANVFGRKVAKYAIKVKADAVISYDTFSRECFRYLKDKAPNMIRIMDASAANIVFQKEIFEKDKDISPDFFEKLYSEVGYTFEEKRQKYYLDEILLTQYMIAASKFTKESFSRYGLKDDNIYICPYGVNTSDFPYKERTSNKDKVRFVFVGGTKQAKGLSYLLNAYIKFLPDQCSLTVVGVNNLPENLKSKYSERVNFTGLLLHSEIPELLHNCDVMIFPSLSDGFGLAAIEAMATGCPVISSKNAGVSDLIQDGVNGFIIPTQSVNAIYEKMNWFVENKSKIALMGKAASKTAEKYSWDNYDIAVIKALEGIFKI